MPHQSWLNYGSYVPPMLINPKYFLLQNFITIILNRKSDKRKQKMFTTEFFHKTNLR